MKLILVDAYAFIYRSYYAFIKNPRINSKGINTSAIFGFVNTLEEVLRKEQPSHIAVAFDPGGPTFRHELYEQYKAQREITPEVIRESVPVIKSIIETYNIPILIKEGYEADDVIGTIALQAAEEGMNVMMMTPDKDYGQLVRNNVSIYKPKYGSNDFETLGVKEVLEKFNIQQPEQVIDLLGLMGDKSDNIPGCPGIGEKTAQKLLSDFGSIETLLENTHQLKGAIKEKIENHKEEIIFSKILATIKTDVPITFDRSLCQKSEINTEKLKSIFDELEFKTLAERILGTRKNTKPANTQLSLFDISEGEDTEEKKYSTLETINSIPHTYLLLDNEDKIREFALKYKDHKFICFDTETTGVDPITAQLVGMSFAFREHEAYYLPVPEDFDTTVKILQSIQPILENPEILKIGQNIKFDILVLKKYGIEVAGKLFDTMISHYLINPELRHGMDYLAEIYLNYQTIHIEELIGPKGKNQKCMRQVPVDIICDYAAEDADITLQLKNILEKELKKQDLESLFYDIEMPLVYVLADMEWTGVKLDTKALNQSAEELRNRLDEIGKEIFEAAGNEFNINSAKQVGEILFDKLKIVEKAKKTKTGQYTTSEETLENLRGKHSIVGKILEYRGLKKLLSTYIDALPELINPQTGKIHTSFNQTVTATGRLSSSNPNLQNIPIRDDEGREIRKAFVASSPDHCFFSADYSQIELRIMAHLSQDPTMIEAFSNNEDIHASTAAKIYNIESGDVTHEMRRKAKTANFGIIYGISVFGLSERLTIPRGEAKELIDGYFNTYPKVKEYMDKSIEFCREHGYVETLLHRKRFIPDITSKNAIVRGYAERNAINAPIQGSAADIIKIAMIRIFNRLKEENLQSKMTLQVHDELNFDVLNCEADRVKEIVVNEMENAIKLTVPLSVDYGIGNNWLEAH
ncbi:MAG: DNA polymerase I [Bacteroidales bacterium]|nr:DNA polymerase I [Bacteroidales bacterium]